MANTHLFKTILCPVDFSEHSRQALRYAALLASRGGGRLTVLFVEDPLLAAAAAVAYDEKVLTERGRTALRRFVERTITPYKLGKSAVTVDVAVGKPQDEILKNAKRLGSDLIVMGAHGLTGPSKMMLGSTTHRVLRGSTTPVLAIPPIKGQREAPPSRKWPGAWVVAPVDLDGSERADAAAAAAVARELDTRLVLLHIVEPVPAISWIEMDVARRNRERVRQAAAKMEKLASGIESTGAVYRVATGKPADRIAAIASDAKVGLVILTRRRGHGLFGPRQGAISYQVLSTARTPVLALPNGPQWIRRTVSPKARA
jgi:nucleotide-binding universal stress UspA family protein